MARGSRSRSAAGAKSSGKQDKIPGTVKPTVEELNDEQRQALFFQHKDKYVDALAKKKRADADFKNACKLAKAELGKSAVLEIKDALALDEDEGEEKLQAEIERKLRVARWMGASVGSQFEMFPDRQPLVDKAYDDGKRAALKGEPCKPPHAENSEQGQRWMQGHHDASAALRQKTQEEVAAAGDIPDLPTSVKTGFAEKSRAKTEEVDKQLRNGGLGSAPATHQVVN